MTEKELIKKLFTLQSVQPESHRLRKIQKEISEEIGFEKPFGFKNFFSFSPVTTFISLAAVVLLFLITLVIFFPNTINRWIITTEISFVPDQYQKAKIALDYTQSQFANSSNNVTSLSQTLALTNTEMSGLTLKGEKGKYTMQQCLALYTKYHMYLETMKKSINASIVTSQDKQSEAALVSKINLYDEQAEKRLHKYKQ